MPPRLPSRVSRHDRSADPYAGVDPSLVSASLADAQPTVFWTDQPHRPQPRPVLAERAGGSKIGERVDLAIVGGGFTGLWAALQIDRIR